MVLQHTEPTDVVAALDKTPDTSKTPETPLTATTEELAQSVEILRKVFNAARA